MQVPKVGGPPAVLASGQNSPGHVTVQGTWIYWTSNDNGGEIWRVPLGGGTSILLAAAGTVDVIAPGGLRVDKTNVYFTNQDGSVVEMSLSGGNTVTINSGMYGTQGDIAVDATNVYWLYTSQRTVMQEPIAGGPPIVLANGQNGLGHIALDATSVYWTATNDGTVMKEPIGGGPRVLLAQLQSAPTGIAVDATSVYWTNYTGAGSCALGSVMKVPVGGGTPTAIATDQLYPDGIAVDGASVYWTTGVSRDLSTYNGSVMKLTPK